jgi:two-component system LytT family response regulator
MLRALIVDDERLARQAMRRLLAAHPEVEIAGEADSLAQAIEVLRRETPEVVFLDIALGDGDGFELIAALEQPPIVVFVTAYAEYAVEAFGVEAVDYLLKPVEPERLAESLARVERKLARPADAKPTRPSVIALKTPKRTVMAEPGEIAALRADGDFTRVLLADRPEVMIWRTLAHFELLLPSPPFFRLGRSLIVNRDRLRSVEAPSRESASITLQGIAEPLDLGRTAAQRLREILADDKPR